MVGPGFHPVPFKMVAAISSGQFVEFAALLAKPAEPSDEPTISVDGRVVVSPAARPRGASQTSFSGCRRSPFMPPYSSLLVRGVPATSSRISGLSCALTRNFVA